MIRVFPLETANGIFMVLTGNTQRGFLVHVTRLGTTNMEVQLVFKLAPTMNFKVA